MFQKNLLIIYPGIFFLMILLDLKHVFQVFRNSIVKIRFPFFFFVIGSKRVEEKSDF